MTVAAGCQVGCHSSLSRPDKSKAGAAVGMTFPGDTVPGLFGDFTLSPVAWVADLQGSLSEIHALPLP